MAKTVLRIAADPRLERIIKAPAELHKSITLDFSLPLLPGETVAQVDVDDVAGLVARAAAIGAMVEVDLTGGNNGEQILVQITAHGTLGSIRQATLLVIVRDPAQQVAPILIAPGAIVWRGDWAAEVPYIRSNVVRHGDGSWLALRPSLGIEPIEGPDWAVLTGVATAEAARIAAEEAAAATILDRIATGEDRTQTGLDAQATGADRIQTGLDAQATAADRLATGLDAQATAADRLATGGDRLQTGLDAQATAADRIQTGQDVLASGQNALDADASKQAAELAETGANAAIGAAQLAAQMSADEALAAQVSRQGAEAAQTAAELAATQSAEAAGVAAAQAATDMHEALVLLATNVLAMQTTIAEYHAFGG